MKRKGAHRREPPRKQGSRRWMNRDSDVSEVGKTGKIKEVNDD
jgi:hypothetical protein